MELRNGYWVALEFEAELLRKEIDWINCGNDPSIE